jgi:hypothetical protein
MPVKWLELEEVMTNCGSLIALMWHLYGIFFRCPLFSTLMDLKIA